MVLVCVCKRKEVLTAGGVRFHLSEARWVQVGSIWVRVVVIWVLYTAWVVRRALVWTECGILEISNEPFNALSHKDTSNHGVVCFGLTIYLVS